MSEQDQPEAAAAQGPAGPQVVMQKIYLRDASVEVPNAPAIFTLEWQPKVDVQLNTAIEKLGDDNHEVTIAVTVTAKLGEQTAYLVEVQQAGIFRIWGFDDEDEHRSVLGAWCPNVIFPYLREAVSELVQRAGFPQFLLQPVNFDALFREYQKQAGAAGNAPGTAH